MFLSLAAASVLFSGAQEPVELLRKFKVGETLKYQVRSLLVTETKTIGMPYFQPDDMEINYDSTIQVKSLKADGFAEVIYRRPTMDIVEGENAESDRKVTKEKSNIALSLTLSPINEVTNMKELTEPAKPGAAKKKPPSLRTLSSGFGSRSAAQDLPFIGELYRLALFVGSLDTALDMSPKLPFEEVKPGDTWKKTASYQPQTLKGSKGKMAVQRLDWTYKYEGVVESNGKKVHRISGSLKLETDAATFINQAQGTSPSESGLEALPLKLDSTINFDLDLNTKHTIYAFAETKGTWSLKIVGAPETVQEEKLTGRTTMTLAAK